ncbi:hypothetical protein like AT4G33800 [Hibiscus trionum]|uniref:Uncharacterized protein n=1 Tax=Hibiscus trionum TaxID=183268 RepID=A0A9W7LZH0_HIBTR|nr:hypothetical protein like AT4G33800 [Hibiscus trionum]
MNFIASECSSGCESGWTNYLEQSFLSANPSKKKNVKKSGFCEEEEEEDLSMVSDASSGPPHFYEDKGYSNDGNQLYYEYMVPQGVTLNKNGGGKRHRNKQQRRSLQVHEDDDTATSPFINYSKNKNNQAPMGFSATHFEGGSNFEGHFGFLQSSSPSANQLQNNQSKE